MKAFFKTVLASTLGFIIGSLLLIFLSVIFITALVSSLASEKEVQIQPKTVLHFKPSLFIGERTAENPLANIDLNTFEVKKNLGLNDLLEAIQTASGDANIQGIYLELTPEFTSGHSSLEEIRNALIAFRDSGKFVYAYAEVMTEPAYYLASISDKVYLNPSGEIIFNGMYADVWFYKNALEKLGVEVQVFKYGRFKSAVEPFVLDKLSPENRLQIEKYVESLYGHYIHQVAASREIDPVRLRTISDSLLVRSAQDAVSYGLIDTLGYESDLMSMIRNRFSLTEDQDIDFLGIAEYHSAAVKTKNAGKDRIAVLYAVGTIQSSGGGDEGTMTSDDMVKALREIRKDKKIKALVLRINSPGGSALASDVIYKELELTRKQMPIIVSMGDVAASGGYYLACAGDTIVAQPNTITGSIGVFGLIPNFSRLLNDKLGITVDGVKTGVYSDLGRTDRPMTEDEKQIIQQMINRTYENFVNIVADSRERTFGEIDSIAEGRVWTGEDALKIGLVDVLGGIDLAMKLAAERVSLAEYRVVEYPKVENPLASFLGAGKEVKTSILKEELGFQYEVFMQYKKAIQLQGIQMRLPYDIVIK